MGVLVRVYLDMCVLKRPWDDQGQEPIAQDTAALSELLALVWLGRMTLLQSLAHEFENAANPDRQRARVVARWLGSAPLGAVTPPTVQDRARDYRGFGVRPLDALHLAWAQELGADLFVTVDVQLVKRAKRAKVFGGPRLVSPAKAVSEVLRWHERS